MRISDWSSDVCSSELPAQGTSRACGKFTVATMQSREAAQPVRDLLDARRPGRVTWIGTACDQILHHQKKIEPQAVDRRVVDQRVFEWQLRAGCEQPRLVEQVRSEEHTSELQSLMRISYAVFCLKKKTRAELHAYVILGLHTTVYDERY